MGAARAGVRHGTNVAVKLWSQFRRESGHGGMMVPLCLSNSVRQCVGSSSAKSFLSSCVNLVHAREIGNRSVNVCTLASPRASFLKENGRVFSSRVYRGKLGGHSQTSCRQLVDAPAGVSKVRSAVDSGDGGRIVARRAFSAILGSPGRSVDPWTTWRGGVGIGVGIAQALRFYGNCYFDLSKARLSFFVVSTAAVGFVMGSGEVVDWRGLAWTSVGTMLTAASANSFNQILEVANDGRMKRTMGRPLPAGRMSVVHALAFAMVSGITGVTLLACQTTDLAAELGAANVLLYTLVYTPLKQIHYVNTWIGAVVGAIPPLLGWAAAAGQLDRGAWVLASALYFWQIPHFMALAFLCRADYARGGYKMLSLLDESGRRTALCALRNCAYLLPVGFLAQEWGTTSSWYFGSENLSLTIGMLAAASVFYLRPSPESARRLFRTSLLYLPIVMTAMVVHRIPNPDLTVERLSLTDDDDLTDSRETRIASDGSCPTVNSSKIDMFRQSREHETPCVKDSSPQPPISFVSIAPFPFLPAPDYS